MADRARKAWKGPKRRQKGLRQATCYEHTQACTCGHVCVVRCFCVAVFLCLRCLLHVCVFFVCSCVHVCVCVCLLVHLLCVCLVHASARVRLCIGGVAAPTLHAARRQHHAPAPTLQKYSCAHAHHVADVARWQAPNITITATHTETASGRQQGALDGHRNRTRPSRRTRATAACLRTRVSSHTQRALRAYEAYRCSPNLARVHGAPAAPVAAADDFNDEIPF